MSRLQRPMAATAGVTPMATATDTMYQMQQADYVSQIDAARMLRVSTRTIRRWADAGKLTVYRDGGTKRYRVDEVRGVLKPERKR